MESKALTKGDAIASPFSSTRLIKCAKVVDFDDPVLTQFNATCIDGLVLAQHAGHALVSDVVKMTGLHVSQIAQNSDLVVLTNNAIVANYLIDNCIICDWRPNLSDWQCFAEFSTANAKTTVLLYWTYAANNCKAEGKYALTL